MNLTIQIPAWLNKARKQITQSDIVIVVNGDDTHNAPGVIKEVNEARQQKKTYIPNTTTAPGHRGKLKELVR